MKILVTGGGTIAPIDDVRVITNVSTGRFSAAISEAALRRGAEVRHLHAPTAILPFAGRATMNLDADPDAEVDRLRGLQAEWLQHRDRLRFVSLRSGTVAEYAEALESTLKSEPIDAVFLAMAVSDFSPVPESGKIPSEAEEMVIRCRRLPKVIRSVRDWAPDVYLVGFKLSSGSTEFDLIEAAKSAGVVNRADLTVANDLALLRRGRHTIHLVRPGQAVETIGPGEDPASRLVDRVFAWSTQTPNRSRA